MSYVSWIYCLNRSLWQNGPVHLQYVFLTALFIPKSCPGLNISTFQVSFYSSSCFIWNAWSCVLLRERERERESERERERKGEKGRERERERFQKVCFSMF